MSNESSSLSELIDACRARSEDLQLPELRPLAAAVQSDPKIAQRWKKSQQIDDVIGGSLRDVPVPDGLEQRLLAALTREQPRPEMLDTALDSELAKIATLVTTPVITTPVTTTAARFHSRHWLRRRWIQAATVSAAAAMVAVLLLQLTKNPTLATQEDVARHTGQWLAGLSESRWSGQYAPSQTHPLPPQLAQRSFGWQSVGNTSSALKVVCYDIGSSQPRTHVFVCVGADATALPTRPPAEPVPVAGSPAWLVGGWQSNGLVYVLAVQNRHQYQKLVPPNSSIAAMVRRRSRV